MMPKAVDSPALDTMTSLLPMTLAMLLSLQGCADSPGEGPADLVLRGGKVITMREERPEARAVAIGGAKIVAVGSDEEIAAYIGPNTEIVELEGRTVIPGFIEGHGHFLSLGESKQNLELGSASSWEEVIEMAAAKAKELEPGEWIRGRGWHQEKWTSLPVPNVEGVPLHHELSRRTPDNPVHLNHASGHASFVNAKALELSGIGPETPDPPGGTIVRDAEGNPTGLLRELASGLVGGGGSGVERGPEERERERRRWAAAAGEEALSKGVTSFHDAGVSFETVDFFRKLESEGALPVRLYVMLRASNAALERKLPDYRSEAEDDDFLVVRSIKRQIDGALGSHGAWLLEPYADMPETAGLNTFPIAALERTAALAMEHGYQLNVHAIGDRGNREVLDIYERTFAAHPGEDSRALRWRIEHAQHLDPADVPRFPALGVIAAMQAVHCTSDGPWVPKRIGEERARGGGYVWRSLLDAGAVIAQGTDVPVEDIDPIANYYASVSRMMNNGERFFPEQAMTREEALRSYTLDAAYAAFEEGMKGSVVPGKLADLVVLSHDLLTIPEERIAETEVVLTIVGGRIRYRANAGS